MTNPVVAQVGPYEISVEAEKTYWWCACGRSKKQPFCDGSHKTTEFTPVKFSMSEAQKIWLCGCKRSSNQPFCDGSHKKITS